MEQQGLSRKEMHERTMNFAVRVVRMSRSMPRGIADDVIAKQLIKSSTSIGANYREASHAKSTEDFASKLKICEGEAVEALYWLQLLVNTKIMQEALLRNLIKEAHELSAIFTASTKTAYSHHKKYKNHHSSTTHGSTM